MNPLKFKGWRLLAACLSLVPLLLLLRLGPLGGWSYRAEKQPSCIMLEVSADTDSEEAPWLRRAADKECTPQKNIGFLKMHKCGSSTVQSILMSYGISNNLTFALPENGNIFDLYRPFLASDARGHPHQVDVANIFASHSVWNHEEVLKVLAPDSKFITIVREPSELYVSMFEYFVLHQYYRMSIEEVIDKVPRNSTQRQAGCLAYNSMLCDLGAQPQDYDRPTTVRRLTAEADDYFDLVMVEDRFDESLVLLCQLLCWSYEDVVSVNNNALKNKELKLSAEYRERLKELQKPDYYVYNYFAAKFDRLVEAYGREKMSHEVDLLRKARSEKLERCQIEEVDPKMVLREVRRYEAKSDAPECQSLMKTEGDKFSEIMGRQSFAKQES